MAGRPLRPATRRRLGRPSPHQQADRPRAHPPPKKLSTTHHAMRSEYPVLDPVSQAYPRVKGRSPTCYSPVRRSCTPKGLTARLACVKHAASVRPEPGSNSPTKTGPTIAPRTGPRRLNVQTGTKPVHEQARHTVEFSRDTRTPVRSSRIGLGQLSYGTWSWTRSQPAWPACDPSHRSALGSAGRHRPSLPWA